MSSDDGGDLCDAEPEVLAGDDVGAPRLRVDLHDLEVRKGDKGEDEDDGNGDRDDERERRHPDHADELEEDLLGRVGR